MKLLIKILREAKKPIIVAGPGIWWGRSEEELEKFSFSAGIPVFHQPWNIRPVKLSSKLSMGLADIHQNPASRLIFQESDIVLFMGCKLDYTLDFGEPPLFNNNTKLITINRSFEELSGNHIADIRILSDLKILLNELKERTQSFKVDSAWAELIRQKRKESTNKWAHFTTSDEIPIHPLRLCIEVLRFLGDNDFVVIDGGDTFGWFEMALNIMALEGKKIRGIFHVGPFDQLGVGVPFATAAKLMHPESNVVLITGDGAFGLAPGLPMETAIHYKLPITVVISNNNAWGMIKQQQMGIWKRTYKTDLRDVPYHKMVEGMGGYGELVEDPNDLKLALNHASDAKVASCINVKVANTASPITAGLIDIRERSSIE